MTDIDLSFGVHPVTGDVSTRRGVSAIMQSLRCIVLTSVDDIPFDNHGWGNIHDLLGETIHPLIGIELETHIRDAIDAKEPRVEVVDVKATPMSNFHGYDITISFYVVNVPVLETVTVPLTALR